MTKFKKLSRCSCGYLKNLQSYLFLLYWTPQWKKQFPIISSLIFYHRVLPLAPWGRLNQKSEAQERFSRDDLPVDGSVRHERDFAF